MKNFALTPANQTTIIPPKAIKREVPRSGCIITRSTGATKATIGIRYLSLVGSQSNTYEKTNKKYTELSKVTDNNGIIAKWLVDLLEGIRNLKPSRGEITHQELIARADSLLNLSKKMPKN